MQKKTIAAGYLAVTLVFSICSFVCGEEISDNEPALQQMIGEWIRVDGTYTLRVSGIRENGTAEVEYLNPNRINVSEARASFWKGYLKLFIKLQDKGYPGSAYTLYYYKEKNALAGFYYQAVTKQTYEVIFVRKK